jgi:RNA polymerase sigma-70 factor (ECF subfamily)
LRDLTTYDDQALLDALKQGTATAFTEIYQRYWRKLFVMAYHRLGSRPTAEDIVHEVFMSLWKHKATVHSIYAYLSAATRYAILREVARSSRRSAAPAEEQWDAPDVDTRFLEKMIAEEIHHLPSKCRLVFQYSREAGLSNREIAHRMGISEKAVEKHITKALSHLRVQLRHFFHFFF